MVLFSNFDPMKEIEIISPLRGELPSQYADRLGVVYSSKVTNEHKKENGQFFTPFEIGQFMGNLCTYSKSNLKILDPGFGVLVLSCSLIESLIKKI